MISIRPRATTAKVNVFASSLMTRPESEINELQDKSERYYFKESINLGRSELSLSSFDLNIKKYAIKLNDRNVRK